MRVTFSPALLCVLALLAVTCFGCVNKTFYKQRAQELYQEGQTLANQGELDQAMEKFTKSLQFSKDSEYLPGVAHNLNEMGIIKTQKRLFEEARELFLEAKALYEQFDSPRNVSKTMDNIAVTYRFEGKVPEMTSWYEKLAQWDLETGNTLGRAIVLSNLAAVYEKAYQDTKRAMAAYAEAAVLFKELGHEDLAREMAEKYETLKNAEK